MLSPRPPPPPSDALKPSPSSRSGAAVNNSASPGRASSVSTAPLQLTRSTPSANTAAHHTRSHSQTSPNKVLSALVNRKNNNTGPGGLTRQISAYGGVGMGQGIRRAVFCDVVLDGLEMEPDGNFTSPQVINSFIAKLGTRIESTPHSGKPRVVRPATPLKARRVDDNEVKGALQELCLTERNYGKKIKSLLVDYAVPLRRYAKSATTAIIPPFEARHLFVNLEELVEITDQFGRDLDEIVHAVEQAGAGPLPETFGETILRNVETMSPFRKWLSNVGQTERIYTSLIKTNPAFVDYIERQQIASRETAGTTGGFREFLAEPFQRISRYSLMIDPIIRHLADDDVNLPYLEEASDLLSDICKMEEDEGVSKAAAMWGLKEAIENFPHAMISSSRSFISCLDVDEIVPTSATSSSTTTLRCTLFLFSDRLVIAKRPVGETKTGRQWAGLDNLENLTQLYTSSTQCSPARGAGQSGNTMYTLPGSPKKLKRGVMGYRGSVELTTVIAVDLGGFELGLVFEEPIVDQSERWNGRAQRRFRVANTYPEDVKGAEKTVWLGMVAGTKGLQKAQRGFIVIKGNSIKDKLDAGSARGGGESASTRVYWSICVRRSWDNGEVQSRGPLVLHVDADGKSSELTFGTNGDPSVIARANLLGGDDCSFSVRSHDRVSEDSEMISVERIIPAISDICASYGLFEFSARSAAPTRPTSASSMSLSRPRSLLLSAAYDVFGSNTASLRRGQSNTSKTSAGTTTSLFSRSSSTFRPTLSGASEGERTGAGMLSQSLSAASGSRGSAIKRQGVPIWNNEMEEDGALALRRVKSSGEENLNGTQRARHTSLPPPAQSPYTLASPAPRADSGPEHYLARSTSIVEILPLNIVHAQSRSISPASVTPTTPSRRRVLGPRAPGSAPNTSSATFPTYPYPQTTPIDSPMHQTHRIVSGSKRPLVEPAPRTSPAKKIITASLNEAVTPPRSAAAGSISRGSSALVNRVVSGGSIRRRERRGSPSLKSEAKVLIDEAHDTVPPFDELQRHINLLKSLLSKGISNKENDRVMPPHDFSRSPTGSIGGMSRSPKTANVHLKYTTAPLSLVGDSNSPDLPTLVRWVEGTVALMAACEKDLLQSRSSSAEHDINSMLISPVIEEGVLDKLREEVEMLKRENEWISTEHRQAQAQVAVLAKEKLTLQELYDEMKGLLQNLYNIYDEELDGVFLAAQRPETSENTKTLLSSTRAALAARNTAQAQLADLKRDFRIEMSEKEEWGRILREHKLL